MARRCGRLESSLANDGAVFAVAVLTQADIVASETGEVMWHKA
jgi:hypothetical protein